MRPTRLLYFRRPGQEKMREVTYPGLQAAMRDNPASTRELNLAMSHFKAGPGVMPAWVVPSPLVIIGGGAN